MRIIHLQAENYKRLVAIDITPEGHLVDIKGRNAQGKSSTLDAIYAALAGASALPSKPIRKGEESARIQLDLGNDKVELVVRRTFSKREDGGYTTQVVVENHEGARYGSPQKILDGLLGALSFDPLAFSRMAPKEQLRELRDLVPGIDFAAIDAANKNDYDLRTDVNRRVKATRAQLDALKVPGDPRQERVDEVALVGELTAAGEQKAAIERERTRRTSLSLTARTIAADAEQYRNQARDLREQVKDLQKEIAKLEGMASKREAYADDRDIAAKAQLAAFEALPPVDEPADTAALVARIDAARKTNADVTERERVLKDREQLEKNAAALDKQSQAFTDSIDKRERDKVAAVEAAQLPVDGLGFGADEVLFNGLPFDQASDAEKLRVSVAIAAAKNPKLRVIRVRDGSLLDDDGIKLLAEFAAAHDLQVWLERVSSDKSTGIVIEDGRLVASKDAAA